MASFSSFSFWAYLSAIGDLAGIVLVVAVDVAPLWLWGSSSARDFCRSCRFCDGAFLFSSVNFVPVLSVVSLKLFVAVGRGDGLDLLNGILRSCCDGSQVFHVSCEPR
jgi:hypothetical protein